MLHVMDNGVDYCFAIQLSVMVYVTNKLMVYITTLLYLVMCRGLCHE